MLLLKNANVITMLDDKVLKGCDVVLDNKKILDIKPSGIDLSRITEVINCTEKYVMPGLHDMHMHMYKQHPFNLFIPFGVTTVRNMNADGLAFFRFLKDVNRSTDYPKVYSTGPGITPDKNIYQRFPGMSLVNTCEEIKKAVIHTKSMNCDFVKILGDWDDTMLNQVAQECRKNNISVAGHLSQNLSANCFMEIVGDEFCVEHIGTFLDENQIETYGNMGLFATATAVIIPLIDAIESKDASIIDKIITKDAKEIVNNYFEKGTLDKWYKTLELAIGQTSHRKNTSFPYPRRWGSGRSNARLGVEFYKAGGQLMAGTDFVGDFLIPGYSLHQELQLYVNEGLRPYDALKTATVIPSDYLKSETGTIEKGKLANLIILNENPLEDIRSTLSIKTVVNEGVIYDEVKLKKLMESSIEIPEMI